MHDIGERNDTLELDRALLACFISTRFLRSACPWTRNYCNVMLFSANLFFFLISFFFWNARYCLTRAEKRYRRDTRGSIGAIGAISPIESKRRVHARRVPRARVAAVSTGISPECALSRLKEQVSAMNFRSSFGNVPLLPERGNGICILALTRIIFSRMAPMLARRSSLRSLRYATLSRSTRSTISERDTHAIRLGFASFVTPMMNLSVE